MSALGPVSCHIIRSCQTSPVMKPPLGDVIHYAAGRWPMAPLQLCANLFTLHGGDRRVEHVDHLVDMSFLQRQGRRDDERVGEIADQHASGEAAFPNAGAEPFAEIERAL